VQVTVGRPKVSASDDATTTYIIFVGASLRVDHRLRVMYVEIARGGGSGCRRNCRVRRGRGDPAPPNERARKDGDDGRYMYIILFGLPALVVRALRSLLTTSAAAGAFNKRFAPGEPVRI